MDELTVLKKLGQVRAPEYFEQRILAELQLRKRKRLRNRQLRLSFAGASGALAVILVIVGLVVLPQDSPVNLSSMEKSFTESLEDGPPAFWGSTIPITETVDYSREVRSLGQEPPTVYILEQVSNRTDANIKY